MTRNLVVASMALAVGVLSPPAGARAEPCCGHHGGCADQRCADHHGCRGCAACVAPLAEGPQQGPTDGRAYDPDTVTTLKGTAGGAAGHSSRSRA